MTRNDLSPKNTPFSPGQRWISTSEPELGLGIIISCTNRRVEISFVTHAAKRTYAFDSAPLQRIVFAPGNIIAGPDGRRYTVASATEDAASNLITYHCGPVSLREDTLADTIAFSTPQQRLCAGIADDIAAFNLRSEAVRYRAECAASPVRGFSGGRIDLIPHQLYIADQATARSKVRVLLADETGLGKTIEACLILHRLLLVGQATRALILVPDALVHQWFVELLRRFNLTFRLLTEEIYAEGDLSSPFDEDPLWICSISTLRRRRFAAEQVAAAQWDIVIVDEAHHITTGDPLFSLLQTLSQAARSMVLLSATPEQFGRKGHHARLRLLDPQRYGEIEPVALETKRLQLVAACMEKHLRRHTDTVTDDTPITLSDELYQHLVERLATAGCDKIGTLPRTMTTAHLVDLFGAGRAYFRNTRRTISGFPKRLAEIIRIEQSGPDGVNPHAAWIASFLKKNPGRKVLVITSTIDAATTIRDGVKSHLAVDIGLFHESMTLLQRDRQAAWFAEENGARLLVCSESGSEGRNFQFCSDLVLLDVPWNPELLEQRIGRLDRIGQRNTINLHIPVIAGSKEEALCRWYHEGVDAFEKNVPAAATVFEEMLPRLEALTIPEAHADTIEQIILDTRKRTAELTADLFEHRDFLLEFASNNSRRAQTLINAICKEVDNNRTATVMGRFFDHFGIRLEDAGTNRFALITEYCTDHAFPLPRSERPVISYDRTTACAHDTIEYLTPDHPMVTGALDLYLSSAHGTSSFALWNDPTVSEVLLESLYVAECITPPELRLFRFFTPKPLRLVVNHHRQLVTGKYPSVVFDTNLKNGPVEKLVAQKQLIQGTFPNLIEASDAFADELVVPMVADAKALMHKTCAEERKRLTLLQSQGAPVTGNELVELDKEEQALETHLSATRVRRDSLRLIWRGAVRG